MSSSLYRRTWGDANNPVVLLLHGFMGDASDWAALAETLSDSYRVVAPDLPGHGQSKNYLFDFDLLVDELVRPLPERVFVLGYSMGGRIAGHLATRHSDRVEALVLESAHPGLLDPAQRASRVALDAGRAAEIRADFAGFLEKWYRQPLFSTLSEPVRSDLVARRAANDPAALAAALEVFSTGRQAPFGKRLRASGLSALAVAGANDSAYARRAVMLASGVPSIHACVVPDAGHIVHLEQANRFADTVRRFFSHVPTQEFPCP